MTFTLHFMLFFNELILRRTIKRDIYLFLYFKKAGFFIVGFVMKMTLFLIFSELILKEIIF